MNSQVQYMWLNLLKFYIASSLIFMCLLMLAREEQINNSRIERNKKRKRYSLSREVSFHAEHIENLVRSNNIDCFNSFRMDKETFSRLTYLLTNAGGLEPTMHVSVSEQVAMFLAVLAHHTKMRPIGIVYKRSTETVSKCIHNVLYSLMKIHKMFIPKLNPVDADCEHPTWSCFKGCVGAIDGTFVPIHTPAKDLARFRSRKGSIVTNVLAACDPNMLFTYHLVGWEGSTHDSCVLKDAVNKPEGLLVPTGTYYLVDNGYTNGDGFLAPYRGVRYHLKEWDYSGGPNTPQNSREYFNMRHSRARNVIERTFGNLKKRWGILRSCSYYQLETQLDLILSCMLINNFIRMNMSAQYLDDEDFPLTPHAVDDGPEHIGIVETSTAWSQYRDNMAEEMYADWLENRRRRVNAP